LALRSPASTSNRHQGDEQLNLLETLYRDEDSFRIPFSTELKSAVKEQLKDNKGALDARVESVALQVSGSASCEIDRINLRNDVVATYCECSLIPVSTITDKFGLCAEELMELYHAEPISIFSCLQCRKPLAEGSLRVLRNRIRTLYLLSRIEVGDPVELSMLQVLLCDVCEQGLHDRLDEERRALYSTVKRRQTELHNMDYPLYLQTREWKAKRNRKLIQAGNRCELCPRTQRLEVHHSTYERRGYELLEDLVVLCKNCHQIHHDRLPKAA
jgi:5-methylcytosine-specific restriction endonuclease McrA